MLRIGLTGASDLWVTLVADRLAGHGAVLAGDTTDLSDDEAIAICFLSAPRLHLVIGVAGIDLRSGIDQGAVDVWLDDDRGPDQLFAAVDEMWAHRLVPFEANLRNGTRAPRRRTAELAAPDPTWPHQAARLKRRLQDTMGDLVRRIDHVGSTSVPGLPAKDLLDIQVAVDDLDTARRVAARARAAGLVHVPGEWFGTDWLGTQHPEEVLVDADPGRPTNVNIRPVTAPVWRETLLFRDWLRAHPDERDAHAAMKRGLADTDDVHVDRYSEAKMPWIRAAIARAEDWATATTWSPDNS